MSAEPLDLEAAEQDLAWLRENVGPHAASGSELEALLSRHGPLLCSEVRRLRERIAQLEATINTPELIDFAKAVHLESAHQRERWGTDHDAGKEPQDWFWLIGYLAGKCLHSHNAGDRDKALHHAITAAAALNNWHAHILTGESRMRPGIETPASLPPGGGTPE